MWPRRSPCRAMTRSSNTEADAGPPGVDKAAIEKEVERRAAAKNRFTIIGKYVSGDVAVVQTELRSGVDRVIVRSIYEVKGDKITVATLVGQRDGPANRALYRMAGVAAIG
jgi:hypothetical protein